MGTIILLICSNTFMTFAWYYHLQQKGWPLWKAIAISWLIAFVEYCFAVPANRIGYAGGMSGDQPKNDTGRGYPDRVLCLCHVCIEGTFALEIPGELCVAGGSSLLHVQEVTTVHPMLSVAWCSA
jgi:Putative member of DMT superfamily (DUF486)